MMPNYSLINLNRIFKNFNNLNFFYDIMHEHWTIRTLQAAISGLIGTITKIKAIDGE